MRRVIAFDGIDCIGKSYVINFLHDELIRNDYIPYVFHLSGPDKEYKEFFKHEYFGRLSNKITDSLIQWEKFIQLYSDIKTILSASTRNIVLLDRTPYSENIWNMFFCRKNNYENDSILLHFLKMFELLNEEIQFINLDVDSKIITQRILYRDEDYYNYVGAFNRLFNDRKPFPFDKDDCHFDRDRDCDHYNKPPKHEHRICKPQYYYGMKKEDYDYHCHVHECHDRPHQNHHHDCHDHYDDRHDVGKIMFMVNFLKEEFCKLFIILRKFNIDVITYQNNSERDIEYIVRDILCELWH